MAGPTFSFVYGEFTDEMMAKLAAILTKIANPFYRLDAGRPKARHGALFDSELYVPSHRLRGKHYDAAKTGTIGVAIQRRRSDFYPDFVSAAFQREIGAVPLYEIGAYCMAKGDNDWDALRLIAELIADAFGGWVLLHTRDGRIPELPSGVSIVDEGVREVVAKEERTKREERYWLIDARLGPAHWVRK